MEKDDPLLCCCQLISTVMTFVSVPLDSSRSMPVSPESPRVTTGSQLLEVDSDTESITMIGLEVSSCWPA